MSSRTGHSFGMWFFQMMGRNFLSGKGKRILNWMRRSNALSTFFSRFVVRTVMPSKRSISWSRRLISMLEKRSTEVRP